MSPLTPYVDSILTYLTVAGDVIIILLIGVVFSKLKYGRLVELLKKYGLLAAFIVALLATSGSLFYSEIAGYLPCELCWFQRIMMYPQVIILGIAWWKRQGQIYVYSLTLSIIGAVIALYHYLLQVSPLPLPSKCEVVGYAASCSEFFVKEFGYITIPMMALTAFLLIILFMTAYRKFNKT